MNKFVFVIALLFCQISYSQSMKLNPTGINGSVGGGFVVYDIQAPSNLGLILDDGVYLAVSGEKGFGVLNLYLALSLSYLKTSGQVNYQYQSLSTLFTSTSPVEFNANFMQVGLGLRLKLIEEYWFRPYIEGGGLGGYFTVKYEGLSSKLSPAGTSGYKSDDSLLDAGSYYEGGIEISFSSEFGMRLAARFTNNKTKALKTFANQELKYTSEVYYVSALKAF